MLKELIADTWNDLAAHYGLGKVRHPISDLRLKKYKALNQRLARRGLSFWHILEKALPRRGRWAVGHRFPSFNQALSEEVMDRLDEGFYDERSGDGGLLRQQNVVEESGETNVEIF